MRKLTTDQICELNDFLLKRYDLKFDAFRDEVVDHIACEIEEYVEKGIAYQEAFNHIVKKWHFELKPAMGKVGVPTILVKQIYKKERLLYLCFFLVFALSWVIGSYKWMDFTPNVWISFSCVLVAFSISILFQKRFFEQKNYEMVFYMHALGKVMLLNIITLTLAMLNLRQDAEISIFLSSYHLFVIALHVLILNVFLASKVYQSSKIQQA